MVDLVRRVVDEVVMICIPMTMFLRYGVPHPTPAPPSYTLYYYRSR